MTTGQKLIKYAAMAFAVLLCVTIVGSILSFFTAADFFLNRSGSVGELQRYEITEEISKLNIDISACRLIIKTGTQFQVESNHPSLTVEQRDGTLWIQEKNAGTVFNHNVSITLLLPAQTVFRTAKLKTGAGTVDADFLAADKMELQFGAGEVTIETLIANTEAKIKGGVGEITVKDGRLANLNGEMGIGEIKLTGELTGTCDLDLSIGSAKITLKGDRDSYCIETKKGLGEISVGGEKVKDGAVRGSGKNRVKINGGIGEIRILLPDTK